MANQAFDREIIHPLERPLADDIDQAQSQIDRSLRDLLRRLFSDAAGTIYSGFVANGLLVAPSSPAAMSVVVTAGLGFQDLPADVPSSIGGVVGLDDLSPYKPLVLSADQTIAIDASPAPGQNRIDIIEVKTDRRAENPSTRDILNPGTGLFVPGSVNKTLAFDLLGRNARVVSPANSTTGIGYKVGVAAVAGSEVAPATTAGYLKLCEIHVIGGVTTITAGALTDFRSSLSAITSALASLLATAHTWSALQTFSAGIKASNTTAARAIVALAGTATEPAQPAGTALVGVGDAAGPGVSGVGGPTAGPGVSGVGGASSGPGMSGVGGAPNGAGYTGTGTGTGPGVLGTGGAGGGNGLEGVGVGAGRGVTGTSAGANAAVEGTGSAVASSAGVAGTGKIGLRGVGVDGTAQALRVSATSGTLGSHIWFENSVTDPSSGIGAGSAAMYFDGTNLKLKIGAVVYTITMV